MAKLCHIVALAFVGWYLMIPPVGSSAKRDAQAPLAGWLVFGGYDTAHECEGSKFLNHEGHKQRADDPLKEAFEYAQCIASDDPRLAK